MQPRIDHPGDLGLSLKVRKTLSKKELWLVQQNWRETYARRLHTETGKWLLRGFDWHVFSYGYCEYLKSKLAERALENELPATVLVFSDSGDTHVFGWSGELAELRTDRRDDIFVSSHDIIIAAQDFRWTFVLTHEFGRGPYFVSEQSMAPRPHET